MEKKSTLQQVAGGLEIAAIPWNLVFCATLGVWLMIAPAVFGTTGAAANNNYLVGALVITFAVIGFGEPSRSARLVNTPLGAWLLVAPWVLSGVSPEAQWNDVIVGAAVILLSIRRGRIEERFGSWDRYLV